MALRRRRWASALAPRCGAARWLLALLPAVGRCANSAEDVALPAADLRHLAVSSGAVAAEITGRLDGQELDRRQQAIGQEPVWDGGWASLRQLIDYTIGMQKWDPEGAPSLPESEFVAFDPATLEAQLPSNFSDSQLPEKLRGVWCGPVHPFELACFIPYASELQRRGGVGIPAQGFKPGRVFFWDSPGARNTLEFFTRLGAEFQFPRWSLGVSEGNNGSGIWTYAHPPFTDLPYPLAVYEGLPRNHHQTYATRRPKNFGLFRVFWDAGLSKDPALCFCSVLYLGDDVIQRNNFGFLAYNLYRVIDGDGRRTSRWPRFEAEAAGRQLVKLSGGQDLRPDLSCDLGCSWAALGEIAPVLQVLPFALILCCCCGIPAVIFAWSSMKHYLAGSGNSRARRPRARREVTSTSSYSSEESDVDSDVLLKT